MKWFDAAVEKVFQARQPGEDHEPHEAYAADVFAALFDGWLGADVPGGGEQGGAPDNVVEVDAGAGRKARVRRGTDVRVHILVDYEVLVRGEAREGETCEIPGVGPVSYEWVRSLLGDAFLTAVVKKGVDITTVAHLGRHIPAELRTALIVSGRVCDVEGCEVGGYLELDHDHEFAKGGATSWRNLGWLCSVHHRLKTAGWKLGPRDPVTRKRTLSSPDEARRRADAA